jgi:HEAT repeat protein
VMETLSELAQDAVWFVRLRAVVALGNIPGPEATSPLLHALRDSNRLVRMRAAEGLADHQSEMASIFEEVVAAQDQYALYAYLAAIENAGLRKMLAAELQRRDFLGASNARLLLAVLRTGKLAAGQSITDPAYAPVNQP